MLQLVESCVLDGGIHAMGSCPVLCECPAYAVYCFMKLTALVL
jgi:hypothetical protein